MQNVAIAVISLVIGVFIGLALDDQELSGVSKNVSDTVDQVANEVSETVDSNNVAATRSSTNSGGDDVVFTINVSELPEAQQLALKAMGINESQLVVTESVIACAEAKIGTSRVGEIRNGAAPSLSERIELVACYK